MTALDAMRMALKSLESGGIYQYQEAITNLRAAIAEMEDCPKIPKNELPERIYLQVSDDDSSDWYGEVVWKEVTWSRDQIHTSDLVFIRQDLIAHPPAPQVEK